MEFYSELALHVYQQVFLGVDRPLGYTLDRDGDGNAKSVAVPEGVPWYVRHHDDRLPDEFVSKLALEIKRYHIPGLSLASCRQLTDAGFERLRDLNHLQLLDLFNTRIGDVGLKHLTGLQELTSLNLAGTQVTDAGVPLLKSLPRLEKLHLGWTEVGDSGVAVLKEMKSLRALNLCATRITDLGLQHLAAMSWLETLNLQETGIGDSGVANLKPLSGTLLRLYLGYTGVGEGALATLKTFTKLRTLMLRATHLKRDHDPELKKALPTLGGADTGPDGAQEGLIR